MKLDDVVLGELYEASLTYRSMRQADGQPSSRHGYGGCVEVIKIRVHREVFSRGWRRTSVHPDGIRVRLIQDGEDSGIETVCRAQELSRLWVEKLEANAVADAKDAKIKRRVEAHRFRANQLEERLIGILGRVPDSDLTSDRARRMLRRVVCNLNSSGWSNGKGEVTDVVVNLPGIHGLDQLERLVTLAERGVVER